MKLIKFFVMLLLIYTSLTARDENNFFCLDDYQQDWKAGQIGSKIYLKNEALHLTDEGIFLIVGQKAIPLETIAWDGNVVVGISLENLITRAKIVLELDRES